ncbi:MAG: ribonuclease J [Acidimicrobiia bacterium]|nr:ribonuclease J [Acidimicrobiia bacterium]
MSVRISFLGGLGEVGRNCASVEIDGRLALIDCGLMFPEEDMLGVDLVLPDFTSIIERRKDVECVILTHGHEDHIGALAYFLRAVPVPIYGTELAVSFARSRILEAGLEPDLRPVPLGKWTTAGPFKFQLVGVSHSVPQGAAVALDTEEGIVLHSGDFKLDPTPIDGKPTDLPTFAELGKRGVKLLLSDSTNAEVPGFVPSESSLGPSLYELIVESHGRVITACFASHLHRVQQIVNAAVDDGRSFAFLGRSMLKNTEIAKDLGLLDLPEDRLLDIDELLKLPPERTAIISTGSQGEPFAALSLMASGEHRFVDLTPEDTVIISAKPIPGNETRVSRVINGLLRKGATVFHGNNSNVHVSGHAAQEELKTFINVVRPDALVPVHGEYRHLNAHAKLATQMNVPNVILAEDGDAVSLTNGVLKHHRNAIPCDYIYVDGGELGDVREDVLRDRRQLADDGVVVITVGVNRRNGEILIGPDVDSHGLTDDPKEILDAASQAVVAELGNIKYPTDLDTLRRHVRKSAAKVIRKRIDRRPVVLPVVIES